MDEKLFLKFLKGYETFLLIELNFFLSWIVLIILMYFPFFIFKEISITTLESFYALLLFYSNSRHRLIKTQFLKTFETAPMCFYFTISIHLWISRVWDGSHYMEWLINSRQSWQIFRRMHNFFQSYWKQAYGHQNIWDRQYAIRVLAW